MDRSFVQSNKQTGYHCAGASAARISCNICEARLMDRCPIYAQFNQGRDTQGDTNISTNQIGLVAEIG